MACCVDGSTPQGTPTKPLRLSSFLHLLPCGLCFPHPSGKPSAPIASSPWLHGLRLGRPLQQQNNILRACHFRSSCRHPFSSTPRSPTLRTASLFLALCHTFILTRSGQNHFMTAQDLIRDFYEATGGAAHAGTSMAAHAAHMGALGMGAMAGPGGGGGGGSGLSTASSGATSTFRRMSLTTAASGLTPMASPSRASMGTAASMQLPASTAAANTNAILAYLSSLPAPACDALLSGDPSTAAAAAAGLYGGGPGGPSLSGPASSPFAATVQAQAQQQQQQHGASPFLGATGPGTPSPFGPAAHMTAAGFLGDLGTSASACLSPAVSGSLAGEMSFNALLGNAAAAAAAAAASRGHAGGGGAGGGAGGAHMGMHGMPSPAGGGHGGPSASLYVKNLPPGECSSLV